MWLETQPSAQSSFQKLNVDKICQKKHAKLNITFLKSLLNVWKMSFSFLLRLGWDEIEDITNSKVAGKLWYPNYLQLFTNKTKCPTGQMIEVYLRSFIKTEFWANETILLLVMLYQVVYWKGVFIVRVITIICNNSNDSNYN